MKYTDRTKHILYIAGHSSPYILRQVDHMRSLRTLSDRRLEEIYNELREGK